MRPYLNWIEERSTKPPLGDAAMAQVQVASPVDWVLSPAWLTFTRACFLSGWDPPAMLEIIEQGGVDLDDAGRIEKRSLLEFQETLAEVLHWAG